MEVVVIGAGYVGLTTGACLAQMGHSVTCVDIDADRVTDLREGRMPIFEPGLDELARSMSMAGQLHFSAQMSLPLSRAELVLIAVGTPSAADGAIDLTHVEAAVRECARGVRAGTPLVIKSTVVPGTAARLHRLLEQESRPVPVASNPEFLREGSAIGDFCDADRIVIGADEPRSAQVLERLYAPLVARGIPLVSTDTVSAELIKYSANAFLALKIAFINDIADLCEAVGGDITEVANGIGLDGRIGSAFLSPGPGFGGSCFPKDTRALAAMAASRGRRQELVERAIASNDRRRRKIAEQVLRHLEPGGPDRRVAILGCAFKANTDDVREAAALSVVPRLVDAGITVTLHDPRPPRFPPRELDGATWCSTPYAAAENADVVVILTEWDEYRQLDLRRLAGRCRQRRILDYRNLYDPDDVAAAGFDYVSVGRAAVRARTAFTRGGRLRASAAAAPST